MRLIGIAAAVLLAGLQWWPETACGALPEKERKPWKEVSSYVCYYGSGRLEELAKYDVAIIMPWELSPEEIAELKRAGVWVIGYTNIGEDMLRVGDGMGAGGYASYFLDADRDGQPDVNPVWQTCYVDAGKPAWRDRVFERVLPFILDEKGCDGVFLDMVDSAVQVAPSTAGGMVHLIREIKAARPEALLVVNRGDFLLDGLAGVIDGMMIENFCGYYDFANGRWVKYTPEELAGSAWYGVRINRYRQQHDFPVFIFDFPDDGDTEFDAWLGLNCARFNFIPWRSQTDTVKTKRFFPMPQRDYGDEQGRFALDFAGFCRETGVAYDEINPEPKAGNLAAAANGARVEVSSYPHVEMALNDSFAGERRPAFLQCWQSAEVAETHWAAVYLPRTAKVRTVKIYWEAPPQQITLDVRRYDEWEKVGDYPVASDEMVTELRLPAEQEAVDAVRLRQFRHQGTADHPERMAIREIEVYE